MKSISAIIATIMCLLPLSTVAGPNSHQFQHPQFQHHWHKHQRGHWHRHGDGRWVWVPAVIVTGALAYELGRQQRQERETIIVEREVLPVDNRKCTEWREIQTSDGKIYRERTCTDK